MARRPEWIPLASNTPADPTAPNSARHIRSASIVHRPRNGLPFLGGQLAIHLQLHTSATRRLLRRNPRIVFRDIHKGWTFIRRRLLRFRKSQRTRCRSFLTTASTRCRSFLSCSCLLLVYNISQSDACKASHTYQKKCFSQPLTRLAARCSTLYTSSMPRFKPRSTATAACCASSFNAE